jgi:signal transduction histidine kinase
MPLALSAPASTDAAVPLLAHAQPWGAHVGPRATFWLAQLGGWGAYGLSTYLTLWASLPPGERGAYLAVKLLRAAAGFAASLPLLALYRALRRRGAGPAAVLAVAGVACAALGAVWLVAYRLAIAPAVLTSPPTWGWDVFPRAALDHAFVLATWSGVYFGAVHWQAAQDHARRALEAERVAQEARFHALSAQLNPHFLFNALNSIRALAADDPARARAMVTGLAECLRYSLAHEPARVVTLDEELEAARAYLAVESIRFETRLRASAPTPAPLAAHGLPALLVLPLVENAVKHGERGPDGVLRVDVEARGEPGRLVVVVRNTGRLRAAHGRGGTGLGWRTVRDRLAHLFPGEHRFEVAECDGWVTATLELPSRPTGGGRRAA